MKTSKPRKIPARDCKICQTSFTPEHHLRLTCDACLNAEYVSTIVHSETPKAIRNRRAELVKVLRKHGVKWEGA